MVLWFYGYTALPAPVLANARPGASLGHDFMTLRAFPGFHNPMALWFCGSMVPRPRTPSLGGLPLRTPFAGVLHCLAHPLWVGSRFASLKQDFMTFWGFCSLFCPLALPLGEFGRQTLWVCRASLGLSTIKVWAMSCLW